MKPETAYERVEARADDDTSADRYRGTYRSHFTGRFIKIALPTADWSSNDRLYSSASYHSIFHGERRAGERRVPTRPFRDPDSHVPLSCERSNLSISVVFAGIGTRKFR